MNRILTLSVMLAISLGGCATPAVKLQTVEVKVPVATPMLKPDQVPSPPAPLGARPQSLSAAADELLAKICELEGYVIRADPLLRISAGEDAKALPKFPECEGR